MAKGNVAQMLHDLIGVLESPPSGEVMTTAYVIANVLKPYSDDSAVDTGFGFGESHLDFWMDDKAIRVIVKSVPALDRTGGENQDFGGIGYGKG